MIEKFSTPKDPEKLETEPLELPLRIFEPLPERYFLTFASQKAAEKFVIAFWKEVGITRDNSNLGMEEKFKAGMWRPGAELTDGCRTGLMTPTTREQKEDGAVSMVYINGNTGRLQTWGITALKKLISLESK